MNERTARLLRKASVQAELDERATRHPSEVRGRREFYKAFKRAWQHAPKAFRALMRRQSRRPRR